MTALPFDNECWTDPDNTTCRLVHKWTGNDTLAEMSNIFLAKPLSILILILIGIFARWLLNRVIDKVARRAGTTAMPGALGRAAPINQRRALRAESLASLLKSISTAVIASIVVLMIIAQLGYNIGPLLASAGIVGLALGFGAQSLVKDFVSGIFMVFEDQYGVGDWVDLGPADGTVEAVSMRITRIRDVDGTVWYVRNGEITRVGNMSQNWARAVMDIPVAYGEDIDEVRDTLIAVAERMREDEEWRTKILEPPEVWGVNAISAEGIMVRTAIKTAPLEQWAVIRELRERVLNEFERLGIDVPYAHAVAYGQPPRDGVDGDDARNAAIADQATPDDAL
ncbi:small conductance mechanosensitive channel [Mumia flava]|uniref:Small conductance mechanosensitive channel n=1 Tax=Mumia flava TaxID=1348852 RepID=A0A2M9B8C3_9ACTN|nr:mechanosensitive ion channel family protein [Mumia flava]PJJ54178.1 small conductance mechanosensitive channel [Mumia flava]